MSKPVLKIGSPDSARKDEVNKALEKKLKKKGVMALFNHVIEKNDGLILPPKSIQDALLSGAHIDADEFRSYLVDIAGDNLSSLVDMLNHMNMNTRLKGWSVFIKLMQIFQPKLNLHEINADGKRNGSFRWQTAAEAKAQREGLTKTAAQRRIEGPVGDDDDDDEL